jgi:protocatechuate 3,4-dioxygenase alpha subunit
MKETPSQTAGPYVHIGLAPAAAAAGFRAHDTDLGRDIAGPNAAGQRIAVSGSVTDGAGAPVTDVLVEVWQADARGIYPGAGPVAAGFRGWGRAVPDFGTGIWRFETVKPGAALGPDGQPMAPHLTLWLVARGINTGLHTRMYFPDEAAANAADPLLRQVTPAARRDTLVARPVAGGYHFDIVLQGDRETVFLDI